MLAALLLAGGLALAACGGGDGGTPDEPATPPFELNLFQNGSFEEGPAPWTSLDTENWGPPFKVSSNQAHTGSNSALLQLRSEVGGTGKVFGVVGELTQQEFPDVISGYYYVGRWEKGTPKQYLQFVVIVQGATNIPPSVADAGNHQIRYILAGVDRQPTFISNARYVMVSRDPPKVGEWVHFQHNIKEDFRQLWGEVPEGFTNLRILFETRWDDRVASDGPSAADVYYDDLYIGPAQ